MFRRVNQFRESRFLDTLLCLPAGFLVKFSLAHILATEAQTQEPRIIHLYFSQTSALWIGFRFIAQLAIDIRVHSIKSLDTCAKLLDLSPPGAHLLVDQRLQFFLK